MGKLQVMDPVKGHVELAWPDVLQATDQDGQAAVREAERVFNEQVLAGGRLAFARYAGSDTHERIRDFDPAAAEITIIAPMAGG